LVCNVIPVEVIGQSIGGTAFLSRAGLVKPIYL